MTSPLSKTRNLLRRLEKATRILPVGPLALEGRCLETIPAIASRIRQIQDSPQPTLAGLSSKDRARHRRWERESGILESQSEVERNDVWVGLESEDLPVEAVVAEVLRRERRRTRQGHLQSVLGKVTPADLEQVDNALVSSLVNAGFLSRAWPVLTRFMGARPAFALTGLSPLSAFVNHTPDGRLDTSVIDIDPAQSAPDPALLRMFAVLHEVSHCEHYARGPLFAHPGLSAEDNAFANRHLFPVVSRHAQPLSDLRSMLAELVADGMSALMLCRANLPNAEGFVLQWAASHDQALAWRKKEFEGSTPLPALPAFCFAAGYPYLDNGRFLKTLIENREAWETLPATGVFDFVREKASEAFLNQVLTLTISGESLLDNLRHIPLETPALGDENGESHPGFIFLVQGVREDLMAGLLSRVHADTQVPLASYHGEGVPQELLPDPVTRRRLEDEAIAACPGEWATLKARLRLSTGLAMESGFVLQTAGLMNLRAAMTSAWFDVLFEKHEGFENLTLLNIAYWKKEAQGRTAFLDHVAALGCVPLPAMDGDRASDRVIKNRQKAMAPASGTPSTLPSPSP
jgi:hypothetical protein